MKQLIKAQDAAKGVPEGGFPEVLELYKKFEKMVPDYDAVCKAMADDCGCELTVNGRIWLLALTIFLSLIQACSLIPLDSS